MVLGLSLLVVVVAVATEVFLVVLPYVLLLLLLVRMVHQLQDYIRLGSQLAMVLASAVLRMVLFLPPATMSLNLQMVTHLLWTLIEMHISVGFLFNGPLLVNNQSKMHHYWQLSMLLEVYSLL